MAYISKLYGRDRVILVGIIWCFSWQHGLPVYLMELIIHLLIFKGLLLNLTVLKEFHHSLLPSRHNDLVTRMRFQLIGSDVQGRLPSYLLFVFIFDLYSLLIFLMVTSSVIAQFLAQSFQQKVHEVNQKSCTNNSYD